MNMSSSGNNENNVDGTELSHLRRNWILVGTPNTYRDVHFSSLG